MRNAIVAALCGTLAGVAVQAAVPHPVPAPVSMRDHQVTLRELERRVQALEADAWNWRRFYACIHTKHITRFPGAAIPVTWRSQCLEPVTEP